VASGRVQTFNQARGFGFIEPDDGSGNVFLHIRALAEGELPGELRDGTPVTYEVEQTERGLRATGVRILVSEELVRLAGQVIRAAEELGSFLRVRGWDIDV